MMIRGGAVEGSPGFPFADRETPAEPVAGLAKGRLPFLAAVASVLVREQIMPGRVDEQDIRAFSHVNPGLSDRNALQGAALSLASHSQVEAWAVGNLAAGDGGATPHGQWRRLFEGRAKSSYDASMSPDIAKQLFSEGDAPWSMIIRTPVDGRLPRPLVVGLHDDTEALVYDPAGVYEGRPSEYTMTVEDLMGRAAMYSSFGLLAVRAADHGPQGTIISGLPY